jgi:hypothetical protein
VGGVREAGDVGADLRQQHLRRAAADARDGVQALEEGGVGPEPGGDLGAHAPDRLLQGVDVGQLWADDLRLEIVGPDVPTTETPLPTGPVRERTHATLAIGRVLETPHNLDYDFPGR